LFNVYGPGQNLSNLKQGMISIYIAMALKNNKIQIKGSGDRYRDFVYIDDVVCAFLSCIDYQHKDFQVINISTGIRSRVNDVLKIIKNYWPQNIEIEFLNGTPGDQFGIVGNNQKANAEFNW
jgi:UDP-glucose 4-epimerase